MRVGIAVACRLQAPACDGKKQPVWSCCVAGRQFKPPFTAVAAVGCLSFPTLLLVLMLLGPHLSLMTASAIWAVLGGVTGLLAINAFSQPMSRPNPNPPKSIASQGRTLRAWPVIPNLAHELLSDYASLTVSN